MPAELTGALKAITEAAAYAPLNDRAFLRITGPDAIRWLNGMVTNSIQSLKPGEGNYNFLLNAQGRIQADCTIYRDPQAKDPTYIGETEKHLVNTVQQLLDKFIIMDDVEVVAAYQSDQTLLLLGTNAPNILKGLAISPFEPLHMGQVQSPQGPIFVTTPPKTSTPAFELHGSPETTHALQKALTQADVPLASASTLEQFRVLQATPLFGTDIRERDLPQETAQTHALHFAKGCYLGQEIVERIRSRGQVHRQLTPFRLEGTPPTSFPTPLEANGKPAGELTSAATLPTTDGPVHLALGYARREFLETHAPLTYAGGTAHPRRAGALT